MPYDPLPVFLIDRANIRRVVTPGEVCAAHPDGCDRSVDQTAVRFDIVRVDTGQVLETDVDWMFGPPGAMWWQPMSQTNPPSGPDDWTGYTEANLEIVRASYAEHPDWYGGPYQPDPDSRPDHLKGLPRRQPSHLFADGPQLVVICPNGHQWNIDSRASNCTMPYDYAHRCWVRTGQPPQITVDKQGVTCAAGGGSIAAGDYHGFLTRGAFTAG